MSVKGLSPIASLLMSLPLCLAGSTVLAQEFKLASPVDCKIGVECFIQQLPDMASGPEALDPFCGSATYDGHKGTDIRVLSMRDMEKPVPVVAASGGIVKGARDNMPDRLVRTQADRDAVKGRECGNGAVIDHGNGYETQYCHMKMGSIAVKPGDRVETGDTLGFVGASGLVQFPHLHLQVRKGGKTIDPFTGKALGEACGKTGNPLWADASLFSQTTDALFLKAGLASGPVAYESLVEMGGPPQARAGESAIVGWGWFANLKKGDRIAMTLKGPSGLIAENIAGPLERNKADWFGFTGKRRKVVPGRYQFETIVIRDKNAIREQVHTFTVE